MYKNLPKNITTRSLIAAARKSNKEIKNCQQAVPHLESSILVVKCEYFCLEAHSFGILYYTVGEQVGPSIRTGQFIP